MQSATRYSPATSSILGSLCFLHNDFVVGTSIKLMVFIGAVWQALSAWIITLTTMKTGPYGPTTTSPDTGFRRRRRLIWHRRDLRLHDNELYFNGMSATPEEALECISLFIFDPTYFHPQPSMACPKEYDTVWCGPHATQATIEATHALRKKLRSIGSDLLVRIGDPTILIPQLAEELKVDEIIFGEEPGTYEQSVAQQLQQYYWDQNECDNFGTPSWYPSIGLKSVVGYTLFHPDDLPTDPNQWSKLAHPKQQTSKKKQKNKNEPRQPSTLTNGHRADVSPERFRGICRIMGDFRKAARGSAKIRHLYKEPKQLTLPSTAASVDCGMIPSLKRLMADALQNERPIMGMDRQLLETVVEQIVSEQRQPQNKPAAGRAERTEAAGLKQLDIFISSGRAAAADRSRADVVTNGHSSRFSVHLALGTLSPRAIYWKVQEHNDEGKGSCQWLASHLEMRDFFIYTAFVNDKYLFSTNGIPRSNKQKQARKNKKKRTNNKEKATADTGKANGSSEIVWESPAKNNSKWIRWATGSTQFPLIDAAMRELMATGYCSNRVRQNVASFLTKDLQMDWRAGAEWFQFWLEDHCVGANYGNWLYFSGVGPDPKNRHFRSISQMKKYDYYGDATPGSYVRKWVPELRERSNDNPEVAFRPWDFNVPGFEDPIVDPKTQYIWQDAQLVEDTGTIFEDTVGNRALLEC